MISLAFLTVQRSSDSGIRAYLKTKVKISFKFYLVMEQLKVIFIIAFLATSALGAVVNYPPNGYFGTDVTKLTWAHGVNSKERMDVTLRNESIQMLEADIVMGTVAGSSAVIPIMAHPPENVSDLSLLNFLESVIIYNRGRTLVGRKGVKLDFKDQQAAHIGLAYLHAKFGENPNNLQFPIWVNSDVLPGPNGSTDMKVDGKVLIGLQKLLFPSTTLSLGWTTGSGGSYSKAQLNDMANLLNDANSTATITFPLRAQLALSVAADIKALLDESGIEALSPSVTLWEGSSDPHVTQEELREFIKIIGKDRVFVDLPYSFEDGNGGGSGEGPGDGNSTTDGTEKPGENTTDGTEEPGGGENTAPVSRPVTRKLIAVALTAIMLFQFLLN